MTSSALEELYDRVLKISPQTADAPLATGEGFTVLCSGTAGTVIAVGPLAGAVLAATAGLDVTVLYAATIRPFDSAAVRASLGVPAVVLVEPYLAGTSVAAAGLRARITGFLAPSAPLAC